MLITLLPQTWFIVVSPVYQQKAAELWLDTVCCMKLCDTQLIAVRPHILLPVDNGELALRTIKFGECTDTVFGCYKTVFSHDCNSVCPKQACYVNAHFHDYKVALKDTFVHAIRISKLYFEVDMAYVIHGVPITSNTAAMSWCFSRKQELTMCYKFHKDPSALRIFYVHWHASVIMEWLIFALYAVIHYSYLMKCIGRCLNTEHDDSKELPVLIWRCGRYGTVRHYTSHVDLLMSVHVNLRTTIYLRSLMQSMSHLMSIYSRSLMQSMSHLFVVTSMFALCEHIHGAVSSTGPYS